MATLGESQAASSDDTFREAVRSFLSENFPAELKGKGNALASVEGPTREGPAEKIGTDTLILPVEQRLVEALEVEGQHDGLTHPSVRELGPPQVQVEGRKGLPRQAGA